MLHGGSLQAQMLSGDFLREFKKVTEDQWKKKSIDPRLYGFQFQQGTRWNAGLSEGIIAEYEGVLEAQFPDDLRAFLHELNGTDLPTLNVYGFCGEPHRKSVGVYSYPRDIDLVKQRIEDLRTSRSDIAADLAEQGFELLPDTKLVPIFAHRYVVCSPNRDSSVVLSIVVHHTDATIYGKCLQEYLEKEFLGRSS